MEQYKSNVAVVMDYLKDECFSASVISLHKLCYQGVEDFLATTDQCYSFDVASQWIAANQSLIIPQNQHMRRSAFSAC